MAGASSQRQRRWFFEDDLELGMGVVYQATLGLIVSFYWREWEENKTSFGLGLEKP